MVDAKEEFINNVVRDLSTMMDSSTLQILETVIRKEASQLDFMKAETLPSVGNENNMKLLQTFLAVRKLQGIKESTLQQYYYSLVKLISGLDKSVTELTRNDIRMYAVQLKKTMNDTSLDNQMTYISVFFEWLRDEGYVNKNPAKKIVSCKPQYGILPSLSAEEVINLVDVAKTPIEKAMSSFLLSTGVRCGELRQIMKSDVNFSTGSVRLISEKSDRPREVYLTPRASKDLIEYLNSRSDNSPYLFVSPKRVKGEDGVLDYQQISSYSIERIVKGLGYRANIEKKVTVHVFRRTLATSLINNGCPVEVIQRLLGHASSETTLTYYAELNNDSIRQQFSRYVKTI